MNINRQIEQSFKSISELINNESITDIYVDGSEKVYYKSSGLVKKADLKFGTKDELTIAVDQVARALKVRLDENTPYLDARLPGGERINIVIDPIMRKGPCVTIRKFGKKRLEDNDLVRFGTIDENGIEILKFLVKNGKRILISGQMNTGKTTLLNILCSYIEDDKGRIITVEDTEELNFNNPYWVPLFVDKKDIFEREKKYTEVLINTLRMDAAYLIMGEIRGKEASALMNLFLTGHKGMATIHSSSPEEVLFRLKGLLSGEGSTFKDNEMITMVVDAVVQMENIDGKIFISSISEVIKGREFGVNELYGLTKDKIFEVGKSPQFLKVDKFTKSVPEIWNGE